MKLLRIATCKKRGVRVSEQKIQTKQTNVSLANDVSSKDNGGKRMRNGEER